MKITKRTTAHMALLLISGLSCSGVTADVNRIYLENDGFIHFEPEDTDIPADWVIATEIDGFRGTGYLEWTGPDYFSKNNAGNGAITYHFRVETAGNYELRWRSRIAKGDSNTESNDSWARLDSGSNVNGEEPLYGWTKVYMGEANVWSWSSRTVDHAARPVRQFFAVGDHTVEISGRSYGHAIDRIALYRYEDVSFDSGLNGTLALSTIALGDGTIIDPNPTIAPEQEITVSDRENVEPVAVNTGVTNTAVCMANTLTLPAIDAVSVNTLNSPANFSTVDLSVKTDVRSILLSFDLSQLPPISTARLNYSTGESVSNGAVAIYLGSHSDWLNNNNPDTPDAVVQIAAAQGGWEANTRYASALNSSLLPSEVTTLILTGQAGSDTLDLASDPDALSGPTLVVSGNNEFCSDWRANMTEQEQTSTDNETSNNITQRSKSGAASHWFTLLLLIGCLRRLVLRNRSW